MSAYSGRTGPNFSQYLNDLNTIQPYNNQDLLTGDGLNLDQELAMFTNADFTDFDTHGAMGDNQHINFDLNGEGHHNMDPATDLKYEELLGEPNHYLSSFAGPMQPPQQSVYAQPPNVVSPSISSMSPNSTTANAGTKRKLEVDIAQPSPDEPTRVAAEEDKRRRNTAASARFRVKKKQREQALERTVKEVNDKNQQLQAKVDQLEIENKWLKNLITEKSGTQTEKDIAELYQKYRRESEECDSRGSEHKDGVGTK